MNPIVTFFDWLSRIDLYPFYPAWNIVGVVFFCIWILVGFIHLRPKLGIVKGGLFGFFFAFTWISFIDEISIFLSMDVLMSPEMGWKPINFLSRWAWKFFFFYWCFKFVYKYTLPSREIQITSTTFYMVAIYWIYYFLYHYRLFYPFNFRTAYLTPYPRWFVFATGHCTGWIFSTVIYLSIWRLTTHPEPYIEKYGIGEGYMMYALKGLVNKLMVKYNLGWVTEYNANDASRFFPDRDWLVQTNANFPQSDLIFAYNATPEIVKEIIPRAQPHAKILLMASNPVPIAKLSQKVFGTEEMYWATTGELESLAKDNGLAVIEKGHFDCPPWFDHSSGKIAPTKKLGLDLSLCRQLQFFEHFNNRFWSHHSYVLTEVVI